MPAGKTLLTDDGLGITVTSVDTDAWTKIQAEYEYNTLLKDGYRFITVAVRIQVVDDSFTVMNQISPS